MDTLDTNDKLEKLEKDGYYHIYNRGINGEILFRNNENKRYFLKLVAKYLSEKIAILSYCLTDNHYHFTVRIQADEKIATQAFSNLFNAYAKAFNKQEGRTGSLFEKHFCLTQVLCSSLLCSWQGLVFEHVLCQKTAFLYICMLTYIK